MEKAVLEARDALEAAGHQVCIVWRELFLKQEMRLRHTVSRCVLYFETAVLEARNGPKATSHQVCIAWRRLSLRPTDTLESAEHMVCILWRELYLRHEMPLSQPIIRFVLYGESCH